MTCARCGDPESRLNGYCSVYCEDMAGVERERDEAWAELERLRSYGSVVADRDEELSIFTEGVPREVVATLRARTGGVWLSREDADAIGAAIESVVDQDFLPYPLRDALARLRVARERTG